MKKRNLVVANWKMNPTSLEEAKRVFNSTRTSAKSAKNLDVVVAPPFPYLHLLTKLNKPKNIFFGVQNLALEEKGAYTGETSAPMVKDLGAQYAIIGHSERRAMGEINEIVRKKLERAFNSGLAPILCIGEKIEEREAGKMGQVAEDRGARKAGQEAGQEILVQGIRRRSGSRGEIRTGTGTGE